MVLSLAIEARVDEGADARVVANLDVLDVFPNLRKGDGFYAM